MSDPLERPGDRMFTAAAEYFGWVGVDEPEAEPELMYDSADAEHIVAAIDRLTEQTRVANMIAFGQATGTSFRAEIRKALGLSHE